MSYKGNNFFGDSLDLFTIFFEVYIKKKLRVRKSQSYGIGASSA